MSVIFYAMIDPNKYGVSFSVKQCRNFGLNPHETLDWLINQGWRRFRLMSYWDEHEKQQGVYEFTELDWQIKAVEKAGGVFSLCIGVKQPRWPEYHWSNWALQLSKSDRDAALLRYLERVVQRYKSSSSLIMYQLENEALLRGFGEHIDIDRGRLRAELNLVKRLDPDHMVAMSTSNGWGVPARRPRPDVVGFSYYPVMYKKGKYRKTIQKSWLHRLRKAVIENILGTPVFIHELQCEPWGPEAIWKMGKKEQYKSMNPQQIEKNIVEAKKIGSYPIDIWGAEWWYWRHIHGDDSICISVETSLEAQ